jgi:eukaryotic-like serine/threonine-protein kinase
VMVRRTARQCPDVPALVAALAAQITSATAREAFLGQHLSGGPGTAGTGGTHGPLGAGAGDPRAAAAGTVPPPIGSAGLPVSDAWLDQARKLLLAHVGPIAGVLVKRAAERTRDRATLLHDFAATVPEAQRAKLLADLDRLG